MKKILFLFAILISTISYGQLIPKDFTLRNINDIDSAIVILKKVARLQVNVPVSIDVTKEYFAQTRQVGKRVSGLSRETRTVEIPKTTYYEYIGKIYVKKGWTIHIQNSVTAGDNLTIKNKELAEQAFAAILCLIKNSGNKNYDKIIAEISAFK